MGEAAGDPGLARTTGHALNYMVTLGKEGPPWLIQPLGGIGSPRPLRQSIQFTGNKCSIFLPGGDTWTCFSLLAHTHGTAEKLPRYTQRCCEFLYDLVWIKSASPVSYYDGLLTSPPTPLLAPLQSAPFSHRDL